MSAEPKIETGGFPGRRLRIEDNGMNLTVTGETTVGNVMLWVGSESVSVGMILTPEGRAALREALA